MKTFLLLLLATTCYAGGPKYTFDDPKLDDEIRNIYHDIRNVLNGDVRISSVTIGTSTFSGMAVFGSTVSLQNVLIANASAGASGQLLSSRGHGLSPQWIAASSNLFIQYVSSGSVHILITNSTSFTNTNLSVTITPTSSNSRILLMMSGELTSTNASRDAYATFARGGTNLLATRGFASVAGTTANIPVSGIYIDSPGSTSALTYTVQVRISNGDSSVAFGMNDGTNMLRNYLIAFELAS